MCFSCVSIESRRRFFRLFLSSLLHFVQFRTNICISWYVHKTKINILSICSRFAYPSLSIRSDSEFDVNLVILIFFSIFLVGKRVELKCLLWTRLPISDVTKLSRLYHKIMQNTDVKLTKFGWALKIVKLYSNTMQNKWFAKKIQTIDHLAFNRRRQR